MASTKTEVSVRNFSILALCVCQLYGRDRAFEAALQFIPNNPIIVEAGAHVGDDTWSMAMRWPSGKIYAFECHPEVYLKLSQKTSHFDNVERFQVALGDKTGKVEFFLSSPVNPSEQADAQSSLYPPSEEWLWPHIEFKKKIDVSVTTLDDWAAKNLVNHVDFLWLDMQGSECQMLKASPNILSTVKVIKTEFSEKPFYKETIVFQDYADWLDSQGFVCIYKDNNVHGDATFVKRDLLADKINYKFR